MPCISWIILCLALSLQVFGIFSLPIEQQNEGNGVASDVANAPAQETLNPLPVVDVKDPRTSDDAATPPPAVASDEQAPELVAGDTPAGASNQESASFLAEGTIGNQPFAAAASNAGDGVQLPSYTALYSMTDVDLTPQAVAEYLLLSGDFGGFEDALTDLVRAKILSPEEVARYKRVVGWEYENLLREMLEAEAKYLQMFAKPLLENLLLGQYDETLGAAANSNEATESVVDKTDTDDNKAAVDENNVLSVDIANKSAKDEAGEDSMSVNAANADLEALLNALRQGTVQESKETKSDEIQSNVKSAVNTEDELQHLIQKQ